MNIRAVAIYIGHILKLEGLFMLPALLISLFCRERDAAFAFVLSIAITLVLGTLLTHIRSLREEIYAREGFVTVALAWIAISFFGALPFWFGGAIPGFINCWFETVSGFTTTGATILTDVEALPKSMLYWRSFTHWLGGMGVLVFMLAVVPHSRGSGETLHLLRAESPGPTVGKLTPTIRDTTRILYGIYIAMTFIQMILLLAGGMDLFDAVNHAFATAGTGGFSTRNLSIAAYDSVYLQTVIGVFMVLFGINFNIFYLLLLGKISMALMNEEFRAYIMIIACSTLAIMLNILPLYQSAGRALLDSFFQVSSIITTTGFATVDYNLWPQFSRCVLVALTVLGASAGSTGGGIKVMRLLIIGKSAKSEILKLAHPRAVNPPSMDGKRIEPQVISGTYAFMSVYSLILLISMALISLENFSFETTFTSVLTCMGNVGPGLDMVGPRGGFADFSGISKLIFTIDMLFGRLEIFPLLMLFSLGNWKHGSKRPNSARA